MEAKRNLDHYRIVEDLADYDVVAFVVDVLHTFAVVTEHKGCVALALW
jgi:hypothetical protein